MSVVSKVSATSNQMINVTYQWNTKNQSFIDMYNWLKYKGITNCKFHLVLYDTDLLYGSAEVKQVRLNAEPVLLL